MTPQGRVSILAEYRHDLGWGPSTDLVEYQEGSRVVIESRHDMLKRMQDMAVGARTGSGSVTEELIAERRAEAAAEDAEGR